MKHAIFSICLFFIFGFFESLFVSFRFFCANLIWFSNVVVVIQWLAFVQCRSVCFIFASPYFNSFEQFSLRMVKCWDDQPSSSHFLNVCLIRMPFFFFISFYFFCLQRQHSLRALNHTDFPNTHSWHSPWNKKKWREKSFSFADQNLFASRRMTSKYCEQNWGKIQRNGYDSNNK